MAAVFAVLLTMLAFDRPLAVALAGTPASTTETISLIADHAKGVYFVLMALCVAFVSLVAVLAGPDRLSDTAIRTTLSAGLVFSATLLALVLATLLKVLVGRARPELLSIAGPFAFAPFSTAKAMTSFPSAETAMGVAFFGSLAWIGKSRVGSTFAIGVFIPALLIAASRVLVGAHYLSDVLAGMVISVVLVGWLRHVFQEHHEVHREYFHRLRRWIRSATRPS